MEASAGPNRTRCGCKAKSKAVPCPGETRGNGKPIVIRQKIEGLTAIAFSPFEGEPGSIELQGDHGPVEFRNIVLTPLYQPHAQ